MLQTPTFKNRQRRNKLFLFLLLTCCHVIMYWLGYFSGQQSVDVVQPVVWRTCDHGDSSYCIHTNTFDSMALRYVVAPSNNIDSLVDETGLKSHSFFKDEIARKDEIIRFSDSVIKSKKSKKFFQ